ncbi:MAG: hypothetical protein O9327_04935 [Polaromonas sp.]|nr:hypothetical protein [Polaromonas sp.]
MEDGAEFGAAFSSMKSAEAAFKESAVRYEASIAEAHKCINVNLAAAVAAGDIMKLIFEEQRSRHTLTKQEGRVLLRPRPRFSNPSKTEDRNELFACNVALALNQHFPYGHVKYALDSDERKGLSQMALLV